MMFDLMRNNSFLDTYDPFRTMEELERSTLNCFFGSQNLAAFKTDLADEGDHFLLEADLPGFEKKDIQLELQGDQLVIRAERHSRLEETDQKDKIVRRERSSGSYSRRFDVSGIDQAHISAKYENGVLKLTLPKAQAETPAVRKLEIN